LFACASESVQDARLELWVFGGATGTLFRDEHFGALYCRDNGRRSVPPSLLTIALVLQT